MMESTAQTAGMKRKGGDLPSTATNVKRTKAAGTISESMQRQDIVKRELYCPRAAVYFAEKMTLEEYNAPLPKDRHLNEADFFKYKKLVQAYHAKGGAVRYKIGKNYTEADAGRLYVSGGLGHQNMPRELRAFLCAHFYWDIDMENSLPTLLVQIVQKKGWTTPKRVEAYVADTKGVRHAVAGALKATYAQAKDELIAATMGRLSRFCKTQFTKEMAQEMSSIMSAVWIDPEYAAIRAAVEEAAGDKKSLYDNQKTLLTEVLQTAERRVLEAIENELIEWNRHLDSYIHDGGGVRKEEVYNEDTRKMEFESKLPDDILPACEFAVYQKTGFRVKLCVKPMQVFHQVPEEFNMKSSEYASLKQYYEDVHGLALIHTEGRFAYIDTSVKPFGRYTFLTQREMQLRFMNVTYDNGNNFFDKWLQDKNRQSYEAVDFWPCMDVTKEGRLNTFRGFAYEALLADDSIPPPSEEDVKTMMQQWEWTHGGIEGAEYAHNMMAVRLQTPLNPPRVATVIGGGMGLGKDIMFTEMVGPGIIGEDTYFSVGDANRDVFGHFNGQLDGQVMVHCEEFGKAPRDALKMLITRSKVDINQKGVKVRKQDAYLTIVGSTNDTSELAANFGIAPDDRRFALLEAVEHPYKQNKAYFTKLAKMAHSPSMRKHFALFWLKRDISKFDPVADRPDNRLMTEAKRASVPPEMRFLAVVVDMLLPMTGEELEEPVYFSKHNVVGKPEDQIWRIKRADFAAMCSAWYRDEFGKPMDGGADKLTKYFNTQQHLTSDVEESTAPLIAKSVRVNKNIERCWLVHPVRLYQWLLKHKYTLPREEDKPKTAQSTPVQTTAQQPAPSTGPSAPSGGPVQTTESTTEDEEMMPKDLEAQSDEEQEQQPKPRGDNPFSRFAMNYKDDNGFVC